MVEVVRFLVVIATAVSDRVFIANVVNAVVMGVPDSVPVVYAYSLN